MRKCHVSRLTSHCCRSESTTESRGELRPETRGNTARPQCPCKSPTGISSSLNAYDSVHTRAIRAAQRCGTGKLDALPLLFCAGPSVLIPPAISGENREWFPLSALVFTLPTWNGGLGANLSQPPRREQVLVKTNVYCANARHRQRWYSSRNASASNQTVFAQVPGRPPKSPDRRAGGRQSEPAPRAPRHG